MMYSKSPNRNDRRRMRTREQIKQAAVELVLEKGYDAITIQDITEHADLSRATFYIHFKDKEELIREVIKPGWNNFTQGIQELQNEDKSNKSLLYYGLLQDFQLADQYRDLYRILLGGSLPASVLKHVKEDIAANVEEGIRSGMFFSKTDSPPELIAQFMVGALLQMVSWWLEKDNDYTPHQMAELIYGMFKGLE